MRLSIDILGDFDKFGFLAKGTCAILAFGMHPTTTAYVQMINILRKLACRRRFNTSKIDVFPNPLFSRRGEL